MEDLSKKLMEEMANEQFIENGVEPTGVDLDPETLNEIAMERALENNL